MTNFMRTHTISLSHAIDGIRWALKTQPNFRVHATLSFIALWLCTYLKVTTVETSVIVFAIILGFVSEMVNTAIESMTDLITHEWKHEAKIAKDVSAGMMLVVALGDILIAIYIFFPYIVR